MVVWGLETDAGWLGLLSAVKMKDVRHKIVSCQRTSDNELVLPNFLHSPIMRVLYRGSGVTALFLYGTNNKVKSNKQGQLPQTTPMPGSGQDAGRESHLSNCLTSLPSITAPQIIILKSRNSWTWA